MDGEGRPVADGLLGLEERFSEVWEDGMVCNAVVVVVGGRGLEA